MMLARDAGPDERRELVRNYDVLGENILGQRSRANVIGRDPILDGFQHRRIRRERARESGLGKYGRKRHCNEHAPKRYTQNNCPQHTHHPTLSHTV